MSKHIRHRGLSVPTCDKCGDTCGNYQYAPGWWRCPGCIWAERDELITACSNLIRVLDLIRDVGVGAVNWAEDVVEARAVVTKAKL